MKRDLTIAFLVSGSVMSHYAVNCDANIIEYLYDEHVDRFNGDADILLYDDELVLKSQTQWDACRYVEHYDAFLSNIGITVKDEPFQGLYPKLNGSYKAGHQDLFDKMWEHYWRQETQEQEATSKYPVSNRFTEVK